MRGISVTPIASERGMAQQLYGYERELPPCRKGCMARVRFREERELTSAEYRSCIRWQQPRTRTYQRTMPIM
jgi:hypothetical protein